MKNKRNLYSIIMLLPLGIMLSGCPTFATAIPGLVPSLVPSVSVNDINVNTNQISCHQGGFFSEDYCSIPISRFVGITSNYAEPYESNFVLVYATENQQHFFFDEINHTATIKKLNMWFLKNYPTPEKFAQMPLAVQDMYIKMRENYIPKNNYKQLYNSYIYLYTISSLHLATTSCKDNHYTINNLNQNTESILNTREMLYTTFAISYSNEILHHVVGKVDKTYDSENDLYNAIYKQILNIDTNKLQTIAQNIFLMTLNNMPSFNTAFFSESGISFGNIGVFGCYNRGGFWRRYDYEYFGNNISGLDLRVKFKNPDTLANTSASTTKIVVDPTFESSTNQ